MRNRSLGTLVRKRWPLLKNVYTRRVKEATDQKRVLVSEVRRPAANLYRGEGKKRANLLVNQTEGGRKGDTLAQKLPMSGTRRVSSQDIERRGGGKRAPR